jgi:hypothetical protein
VQWHDAVYVADSLGGEMVVWEDSDIVLLKANQIATDVRIVHEERSRDRHIYADGKYGCLKCPGLKDQTLRGYSNIRLILP